MEGLDNDNNRVMIKLTLSGDCVTVAQFAINVINKKEYDQNSKVLSELL